MSFEKLWLLSWTASCSLFPSLTLLIYSPIHSTDFSRSSHVPCSCWAMQGWGARRGVEPWLRLVLTLSASSSIYGPRGIFYLQG